MTSERLEEIRKRRALALQGKWEVEEASPGWKRFVTHAPTGKRLLALWPDAFEKIAAYPQEQILSTAAFIANAPNDIDALLAEVERLREAAKHAFTLEQITATMLKAIDEASNNSTPMPRRQRSLEAVKKKEDKEQREFDERVELACERYRKATEAQQKQCSECGSNNTKRRLYVPTSRPEQWWDCQDCKHYWVEAH